MLFSNELSHSAITSSSNSSHTGLPREVLVVVVTTVVAVVLVVEDGVEAVVIFVAVGFITLQYSILINLVT